MLPTTPVDQKHNLMFQLVNVGNDFVDQNCVILCFSRMSVVGAFHTAGRSCAKLGNTVLSGIVGASAERSNPHSRSCSSAAFLRAAFQRSSSSAATRRLSGS